MSSKFLMSSLSAMLSMYGCCRYWQMALTELGIIILVPDEFATCFVFDNFDSASASELFLPGLLIISNSKLDNAANHLCPDDSKFPVMLVHMLIGYCQYKLSFCDRRDNHDIFLSLPILMSKIPTSVLDNFSWISLDIGLHK